MTVVTWRSDDGRGVEGTRLLLGGGIRALGGGALDVDRAFSPMFNTLPIRRLGLHRGPGDHVLTVVFVALPELTTEVVEQHYRSVSPLGTGARPDEAVVGFTWDAFGADIVVDADAVVTSYPGVAARLPDPTPASP